MPREWDVWNCVQGAPPALNFGKAAGGTYAYCEIRPSTRCMIVGWPARTAECPDILRALWRVVVTRRERDLFARDFAARWRGFPLGAGRPLRFSRCRRCRSALPTLRR